MAGLDLSGAVTAARRVFTTISIQNAVLRVSTETMRQKATEAAGQLNAMRNCFNTMRNLASGSSSYWQGAAGDLHRSKYDLLAKKSEEIFQRLQEHIDDLEQMATTYEGGEKAAQSALEPLSSDVIV